MVASDPALNAAVQSLPEVVRARILGIVEWASRAKDELIRESHDRDRHDKSQRAERVPNDPRDPSTREVRV
jgi:hypothetical protein